MRLLLVCVLLGAGWSAPSLAAPEFPKLTGRVVDQADMLSAQAEQQITALSAAHEQATGNQVVVATLPDLQGYTIEEFGYQLGRTWGIGQKDKNNGVLLLIAKAERKVRIEVGYGLEGDLTDAISSNIISTVITPRFKRAQFDAGLVAGTAAIVDALGGQYKITQTSRPPKQQTSPLWKLLIFVIFFIVLPGWRFFGL
ncbi:MAG: TPM domain-containing protein, partial [Gammaproteobacteria bacterium]|nr:TPM domain-containing protein [Gammaproteobacteria bacterium]